MSPRPTKRRNSDIDVRLMEECTKKIEEEEKTESTSQLLKDTDTNPDSSNQFLQKHHKVLVDSLRTTITSPRAQKKQNLGFEENKIRAEEERQQKREEKLYDALRGTAPSQPVKLNPLDITKN